tara:strand:- start:568 stop:1170 length:603 start_codon:yes stop_codon:yes gene_type:complete
MGNVSAKDNEQSQNKQDNLNISDTLSGGRDKKIISKFRKKRLVKSSEISIEKLNLKYLLNLSDAKFDLVISNYNRALDLLNNIIAEMPPSESRHFINNIKNDKNKLDELKDKLDDNKYTKIIKIYSSILNNNKLESKEKPKKHVKKINKTRKTYRTNYKTKKGRNKKYKRNIKSHRDKYNKKRKQYHRGKHMRRYHRFKN